MADKLTPKQARFCQEYLKDLNGTQAAIRAGYSKKTAEKIASENQRKPEIQAYLSELMRKRERRTEITQDKVLKEMARIAFFDPRRLFDENDAMLPIHHWPDEVAAAVSSIKISEMVVDGVPVGLTKEVKFWSKDRQLEALGRHLGMKLDNPQVNVFMAMDRDMIATAMKEIKGRFDALGVPVG